MLLSSYAIKAFEFDNIYSSNKFYSIHSEILEEIEKKLNIKLYIKLNIKLYIKLNIKLYIKLNIKLYIKRRPF